MASAMRFARPMMITVLWLRSAPTAAATMAKVVMIPSSPPNTSDLMKSIYRAKGRQRAITA
jgi:hypothetical protein